VLLKGMKMTEKVDVCIVGGGVVGLFCALEQAKNGKVVRLIDKLYSGSSRYNMGEIVLKGLPESMSEFAKYSHEQWSHAAADFGKNLGYEQLGCARFSLKGSNVENLKAEVEKEKELGFENVEFIDDDKKIHEKLGLTNFSEVINAIKYSEDESAIDTSKALDGLRKMIIQSGVRIWGSDVVEQVITKDGSVQKVITDTGEECEAKNFIFATGVWSSTLLAKVGESLPIRPARVHILQLIPTGKMPTCILNSGEKYGNILIKSQINGRALVMYTASMDPAQATWSTEEDVELIAWLRRRAGQMVKTLENAELRGVNVVLTAITPDKNPYIGAIEKLDNLYLAAGMNGKSYAYAAGVAKYLGLLLRGEESPFTAETQKAISPSVKRFK
jgi:glycine/D-amino acid oxidase-like deaminating enzyme